MESKVVKAVQFLDNAQGVSPTLVATYLKESVCNDAPVTETDVKKILKLAVKRGLLTVTSSGKYKFLQNSNAGTIEFDAGRRRGKRRSRSRSKSRRSSHRSSKRSGCEDCGGRSRSRRRSGSKSRSGRGSSRRGSRRSKSRSSH